MYFHIRKEDSIFLYYFIQTDNFNKNGRDINILSRETVEPGPCTCGSLDLEKLDICISPFCLGPSLTSLYFPEKTPFYLHINMEKKKKTRLGELYRYTNFSEGKLCYKYSWKRVFRLRDLFLKNCMFVSFLTTFLLVKGCDKSVQEV